MKQQQSIIKSHLKVHYDQLEMWAKNNPYKYLYELAIIGKKDKNNE